MNKEGIIEKLKEMGITSGNCYPKSSFKGDGDVISIGYFSSELDEDFYFYNTYDKKIYMMPFSTGNKEGRTEEFKGKIKYILPLNKATAIWEDKPFEEVPDLAYKDMTLRQYACIKLRIPETNLPWLDGLIKKSKE